MEYAEQYSELDMYGINTNYLCPRKLVEQKVMSQSSYAYATRQHYDRTKSAIENYVINASTTNGCHNSMAEKKLYNYILRPSPTEMPLCELVIKRQKCIESLNFQSLYTISSPKNCRGVRNHLIDHVILSVGISAKIDIPN